MPLTLQSALQPSEMLSEDAGPLLGIVEHAAEQRTTLFVGPALNAVVDRMVEFARAHRHFALLGTSTSGHMLVGAALSRSGDFRPWAPGTGPRVLLVDAVIGGDAGLAHAANIARRTGAQEVDAMVVEMLGDWTPRRDAGFDSLWVVGGSREADGLGARGDHGHRSLRQVGGRTARAAAIA
jgi:hypothetical protein